MMKYDDMVLDTMDVGKSILHTTFNQILIH